MLLVGSVMDPDSEESNTTDLWYGKEIHIKSTDLFIFVNYDFLPRMPGLCRAVLLM